MKRYLLICFSLYCVVIYNASLSAQTTDVWTAFWNEDTTLVGFKDSNNTIRLVPKFMGFTIAQKLDKIMAVTQEYGDSYSSYYITKSGRKFGADSLYTSDNSADCESEGFIRFKNHETDRVGMFNANGEVAIPTEYNALSQVHNGMAVALKGAKKHYWDKHKHSGCNHYSWKGGTELLLDTTGQVLVQDFELGNLNLYSLQITQTTTNDSIGQSFKGVSGKYYTFTDFKKEFEYHIKPLLKSEATLNDYLALSFDSITYWHDSLGWVSEPKSEILNRNFELLKNKLLELNNTTADYDIFIEDLNHYIYYGATYSKYFNNCGQGLHYKYPILKIAINSTVNGDFQQDHFDFLKTDEGYRLIGISLRTDDLN